MHDARAPSRAVGQTPEVPQSFGAHEHARGGVGPRVAHVRADNAHERRDTREDVGAVVPRVCCQHRAIETVRHASVTRKATSFSKMDSTAAKIAP